MAHTNKTPEKDHISGVETTGHEWDGLKELNNPAPRWWLIVWFVTIIWSIGYWVVYPAWPTLSGHTKGTSGWTQFTKLKAEQAEIDARQGALKDKLANASLEDIQSDPKLRSFAVAGGKAAFGNNCAVCHGSGGQGGKGYPNLNDNDWLWGGDVNAIYATLKTGIRSSHAETRTSVMPSFGKDGLLNQDQITQVVDYVLAMSNPKVATSEEGGKVYAENCASCHGEDAKGMREFGAPNLADKIWLYGKTREDLVAQINKAKAGVMPMWEGRLDDATLKQLAVYVHSLGGGE